MLKINSKLLSTEKIKSTTDWFCAAAALQLTVGGLAMWWNLKNVKPGTAA